MDMLERIKDLCQRKGITLAKLESELGFSNGSLAKNKTKAMSSDRLFQVAEYFGVSMDYLMGKEVKYYTDDRTAEIAQKLFDNKEMRMLFDAAEDSSPEDIETIYNMLLALKRKEKGE